MEIVVTEVEFFIIITGFLILIAILSILVFIGSWDDE